MLCKSIMSYDVHWISPEETVARAAKLMAFHNLGLLPVCSADGRAIGVITDRDLALRVVAADRSATQTRVGEVMTTDLQFVPPNCPVDRVGELMSRAGVSRLLVLDDGGHLAGLVSVADLVLHAPAGRALETARGIYAREMPDRSLGYPHPATNPTPEYFQGTRGEVPARDSPFEEAARAEAAVVIRGGASGFKEFGG
jgi:CBS domain-containing protein